MESGGNDQRIKVLINLSSRLLCEALQGLLEQDAAFSSMVADGANLLDGFTPHNIVIDAAALEQPFPVQWGDAKYVLIDTGLGDDELVRILMTHRLHGVISTGIGTELFKKALEAIRAGQIWIDNDKIRMLLHNHLPAGPITAQEKFSKREREIVLLIVEGHTNREIAAQLNVSEQTVKTHISRIFRKTDVTSRTQLAHLALKFKFEYVLLPTP